MRLQGWPSERKGDEDAGHTRPSPAGWALRGVVGLGVVAIVVLVPLRADSTDVRLFTQAVAFAVIGLSLNVLIGYTGQISLGHQGLVGVGAFTSAYLVSEQHLPFAAAVVVAITLGAAQSLVLGALSLRIRGLYFALVTLAYGALAENTLFAIPSLTGGGAGQRAPLPEGFATPIRYYFLSLAVLAGVVWIDRNMMATKGGRALLALREDPRVAATFGIDVRAFTLFAFSLAGAVAALGGALFAHNSGIVVASVFDFRLALVFVIMTTVGGLGSRAGVIVGSSFFALLGYLVEKSRLDLALGRIPFVPDLTPELAPLVVGPVLLLLTLTCYPGGLGQKIDPLLHWVGGGPFRRSAEEPTPMPGRPHA